MGRGGGGLETKREMPRARKIHLLLMQPQLVDDGAAGRSRHLSNQAGCRGPNCLVMPLRRRRVDAELVLVRDAANSGFQRRHPHREL